MILTGSIYFLITTINSLCLAKRVTSYLSRKRDIFLGWLDLPVDIFFYRAYSAAGTESTNQSTVLVHTYRYGACRINLSPNGYIRTVSSLCTGRYLSIVLPMRSNVVPRYRQLVINCLIYWLNRPHIPTHSNESIDSLSALSYNVENEWIGARRISTVRSAT
jgi:hypothetical protein